MKSLKRYSAKEAFYKGKYHQIAQQLVELMSIKLRHHDGIDCAFDSFSGDNTAMSVIVNTRIRFVWGCK